MVLEIALRFILEQTGKALDRCLVSDKSLTSSSGLCSTHTLTNTCERTHTIFEAKT